MNAGIEIQPQRGRFQGVLQIARFNWPQYVGGAVAIVSCVLWLNMSQTNFAFRLGLWSFVFLTTWWCIASLAASHWIYDRSNLYRWTWVRAFLPAQPKHWINLHAGLDESSNVLRDLFPGSAGRGCDFYDPTEMSEPSIRRARREDQNGIETVQVDFRRLPFAEQTFDNVFLLFAAHELRRAASRECFFHELRRILAPDGTILLVEHARDAANFVAFGPGFFHFMAANEWSRLSKVAGLKITREEKMTPFVRILLMKKEL